MRLFAAIPLPDRIREDLSHLQKGVSGAKWVDSNKFHITIGFFGDVSDEFAEVLDMELGRIHLPAFELQLTSIGHFGSHPPISLWTGVKCVNAPETPRETTHSIPMLNPLTHLHNCVKKAARAAKIEMERRDFRPHVTLAYLSPNAPIERIIAFKTTHARYKSARFLIDRFALYSSRSHKKGANTYNIEARYPLLAPPPLTLI